MKVGSTQLIIILLHIKKGFSNFIENRDNWTKI